jgi:hypothetical protein
MVRDPADSIATTCSSVTSCDWRGPSTRIQFRICSWCCWAISFALPSSDASNETEKVDMYRIASAIPDVRLTCALATNRPLWALGVPCAALRLARPRKTSCCTIAPPHGLTRRRARRAPLTTDSVSLSVVLATSSSFASSPSSHTCGTGSLQTAFFGSVLKIWQYGSRYST